MAIQKLKKLFLNATDTLSTTDIIRSINNMQENIANAINPLVKVQNDSSNLSNIQLVAGQVNKVNHRLGRKLLGYNVMLRGTSPQAIISNDQENNPTPQLTLWLWTSVDCSINLQVY